MRDRKEAGPCGMIICWANVGKEEFDARVRVAAHCCCCIAVVPKGVK